MATVSTSSMDIKTLRRAAVATLNAIAKADFALDTNTLHAMVKATLGVDFEIRGGTLETTTAPPQSLITVNPFVGLVLQVHDASPDAIVVLEIETAFSAAIVDRVLGGRADSIPLQSSTPLPRTHQGVLGYFAGMILCVAAPRFRLAAVLTESARQPRFLPRAMLEPDRQDSAR
ncbi:MAG: hypothetical protein R3A47_02020 [Polyangiales bacterium]